MLSAETHWENHDASGEVSSDRSLYNYFRTYDPATGRYLEADPIGQRGGLNPFAYALNDPIGRGDPLGLISATFEVGLGIDVRFTFGFDRAGDAFSEIGVGVGGGLSLTIDPEGQPIPDECDLGDELTGGVSLLGEAGFGLGPGKPGAVASASASLVLNTPACGCMSVSPPSTSVSASRIGVSSSVTVNLSAFRGNLLPQGPVRSR